MVSDFPFVRKPPAGYALRLKAGKKEEIRMRKLWAGLFLALGAAALAGCALTETPALPRELTVIGEAAFQNCALFSGTLVIPEQVEGIGPRAFSGCEDIISVVLGEKVQSVGDGAFSGCASLTRLTVKGTQTVLSDGALAGTDSGLTLLVHQDSQAERWAEANGVSFEYLEDQIDPSRIPMAGISFAETYGNGRFDFTSYGDGTVGITGYWHLGGDLQIPVRTQEGLRVIAIEDGNFSEITGTLTIPEGIVRVGDGVFSGCSFTGDLALPSTLRQIGIRAFAQCGGFEGLSLPEGLTRIERAAFANTRFTGALVLPASLREIGDEVFSYTWPEYDWETGDYKPSFTGKLLIPEGVERVGAGAFSGQFGFTGDLVLPDSLTEIGASAFRNCTGLTGGLRLPAGIRTIGEQAFFECPFTGELNLPDSLENIGNYAFYDARFSGELKIPAGIRVLDGFGGAGFADHRCFEGTLTIPDTVTEIAERAFSGIKGFDRVVIPGSVKTIGDQAFERCYFSQTALGEGIERIGEEAFARCGALAGVSLPDSLTEMGSGAFAYCGALQSIRLSPSLTKIPEWAFAECESLEGDLVIPEGVLSIGENAFWGCSSLTGTLYLPSTLKTVEAGAFRGIVFSGELSLPEGLEELSEITGRFTGEIRIPGSLKTVQGFSIDRDWPDAGPSLVLEEGIETIAEGAFQFCDITGSLHIPSSVRNIGDRAFEGALLNGELTFSEGVTHIGERAFALMAVNDGNWSDKDTYGYLKEDLYLPDSLKSMGDEAFYGAYYTDGDVAQWALRVGPGLSVIPEGAFSHCNGLARELTLSEGLQRIEDGAFTGTRLGTDSMLILPEGLKYLGSLPDSVEELWIPASLQGFSDSVLERLSSRYGPTILAGDGGSAAALLGENGVSYRFAAGTGKLPTGTLYQGDVFALSVEKLILGKEGCDWVRASILSGATVLQSVTADLDAPSYQVNACLRGALRFEELPQGEDYTFRLQLSVGGEVTTLAESVFSVAAAPLRCYVRDLSYPKGVCADGELNLSGTVVCNYPMQTISLTVTPAESAGAAGLEKEIVIPEESQYEAALEELLDAGLLESLANGRYFLKLSVSVPSQGAACVLVSNGRFWRAENDGTVDEDTLTRVYRFATYRENYSVFSPYANWNHSVVELLDWSDVLKMAYQGRWEILDQYVFEGGSDSYMVSFCKKQILEMLDRMMYKNSAVYDEEILELQEDMLGYIGTGSKTLSDYASEKGIRVGDFTLQNRGEDKKIIENIGQIGEYAKTIAAAAEDADTLLQGARTLMTHLAADYTVQMAVLDSVLSSMSESGTAARQAMQEILAEYRDTAYYVIRECGDFVINRGEKYLRGIVLKEILPKSYSVTFKFAEKVGKLIMEKTGWEDDAKADMTFLAWDASCTAALTAYHNAFDTVYGGDTSGAAIRDLELTFLFAKECYENALSASEPILLDKCDGKTGADLEELKEDLSKLKIE